ncbi:hypothetical protein FRACYDRAFT_269781 [Fragilariopsis cylindrus CCMP1102]|uniref:Uncharacterized protein n=1 Tax=Fragilariopsis cylindrus CCMP1102 TaxID=635003 RepID=A0A1E7F5B1_9STRA|nr:hypothetical protein FRACYDRAFT_269781 [Fragilariopsis cylindrus CCMP1102]|eukprot:OEU13346.1 hypothetical protein FRACYDRAFT_269781 [Fragilariopsis cylindrus CCMP1102]
MFSTYHHRFMVEVASEDLCSFHAQNGGGKRLLKLRLLGIDILYSLDVQKIHDINILMRLWSDSW